MIQQSKRLNKIRTCALLLVIFLVFTLGMSQVNPAFSAAAEAVSLDGAQPDAEGDAFVYLSFVAKKPEPKNEIWNIVFDPPSPASLNFWKPVHFTFNYKTDEPGGVRIWALPYTNGEISPGYAYSPSPVYPQGEGSGTGRITISSGDITVDQLWFHMKTEGERELVYELFVPVDYRYSSR